MGWEGGEDGVRAEYISGIGRNHWARLVFVDLVRTVDFEEPRLLLLVLTELQFVHIVLQAEFFEGDGDLVAVRGCSMGILAENPERRVST